MYNKTNRGWLRGITHLRNDSKCILYIELCFLRINGCFSRYRTHLSWKWLTGADSWWIWYTSKKQHSHHEWNIWKSFKQRSFSRETRHGSTIRWMSDKVSRSFSELPSNPVNSVRIEFYLCVYLLLVVGSHQKYTSSKSSTKPKDRWQWPILVIMAVLGD